ncbi:MAG TPA: hypothetical protein VHX86_03935 [Tepidisphaeraceae bacterium]|jgi:hypothetical protein|nr:hypothetical protein [Tepidisphaeraceae bacterium]
MQTLEQRVERLERSCRRWRRGFLTACIAAAAVGAGEASKPAAPPDAAFGHLTVQSLTVRNQPDGALLLMSCDRNRASIQLASPAATSSVSLIAAKGGAHVFVACNSANGITSSSMSADDQSGLIDVRNAAGKNKEIEPQ